MFRAILINISVMRRSIVRQSATELLLKEVNRLLARASPRLAELLSRSERIDQLYLSYVQDVVVLEHLLNDTYQLMLIREGLT